MASDDNLTIEHIKVIDNIYYDDGEDIELCTLEDSSNSTVEDVKVVDNLYCDDNEDGEKHTAARSTSPTTECVKVIDNIDYEDNDDGNQCTTENNDSSTIESVKVINNIDYDDAGDDNPCNIEGNASPTTDLIEALEMLKAQITDKTCKSEGEDTDQQENVEKQAIRTTPKGICDACQEPIVGHEITAMDKTFHPEHFICSHCKKELGAHNFFERDGALFCETDYHLLFSPR